MTKWTHTGAYVAAFALAAIGAVGLACGPAWPSVVVVGLAVALLAAILWTEHHADVRAANSVKGDVGALQMEVHRLGEALKKLDEKAGHALAAATRSNNRPPSY